MVFADSDGNPADDASATFQIQIVDDVPTARADVDSVTEDGPLTADGNVLTGSGGADVNATDGVADVQGADSASVSGVAAGVVASASGSVGASVGGTYGSITIAAGGGYTYTLTNNALPAIQGLDSGESVTDTFSYTITDGDGDTSTTQIVITINGANDAPVVLDNHVWMSSDPAQQTATTPLYTEGYPLNVTIPTDVDGENLIVTASGAIPAGVFYFNGTTLRRGDHRDRALRPVDAGQLPRRPRLSPDGDGGRYRQRHAQPERLRRHGHGGAACVHPRSGADIASGPVRPRSATANTR